MQFFLGFGNEALIAISALMVASLPAGAHSARAVLGVAPEPFVLAVLFGVNFAFCTPMADNCNLLVLNAGGYRFMDFVRVGVPLSCSCGSRRFSCSRCSFLSLWSRRGVRRIAGA